MGHKAKVRRPSILPLTRFTLGASLALAMAAAAGAQELRGRAVPPGAVAASGSAPANGQTPGVTSDAPSGASGATGRTASGRPGSLAPPTSIYGDRAGRTAPAPTTFGPVPPVPLALAGLRGGGDAAPVCRATCAASFYRCTSGDGSDGCEATADQCRARCDISPLPSPGRLTSPLPLAGVAGAGSLRGLPGAPSGRLGQQ